MLKKTFLRRAIAAVLSLIIGAETTFGAKPELNFWAERQALGQHRSSLLSSVAVKTISPLPGLQAYGFIRSIKKPTAASAGTVYLIQDIHANSEAQRNIASAVRYLVDKGARKIFLEGAFDPVQLKPFQYFSEPAVLRSVADYYLRVGKLSGAMHAGILSGKTFPAIVGVDDASLYQANVHAYLESREQVGAIEKEIAARSNEIARAKKEFNPKLAMFDLQVEAYREGKIRIGAYLAALKLFSPRSCEQINNFLEAFALESALDFSKVEVERRAYVHSSTRKLSNYPLLESYARYIKLSERISAEKLFDEMSRAEAHAYQILTRTELERKTVREAKALAFTKKLVNFSLSAAEWKDYNVLRTSYLPRRTGNLAPFESFYEVAEKRDAAMAQNLFDRIRRTTYAVRGTFVLVAGGFHSSGISEKLSAAGYDVIQFTPRVTKVDISRGAAYLSEFAQKRTPLEKFFNGQALFLAPLQKAILPDLGLTAASLARDPVAAAGEIFSNSSPILENREISDGSTKAEWKGPTDTTVQVDIEGTKEKIESVDIKEGTVSAKQRNAPAVTRTLAEFNGRPLADISLDDDAGIRDVLRYLQNHPGRDLARRTLNRKIGLPPIKDPVQLYFQGNWLNPPDFKAVIDDLFLAENNYTERFSNALHSEVASFLKPFAIDKHDLQLDVYRLGGSVNLYEIHVQIKEEIKPTFRNFFSGDDTLNLDLTKQQLLGFAGFPPPIKTRKKNKTPKRTVLVRYKPEVWGHAWPRLKPSHPLENLPSEILDQIAVMQMDLDEWRNSEVEPDLKEKFFRDVNQLAKLIGVAAVDRNIKASEFVQVVNQAYFLEHGWYFGFNDNRFGFARVHFFDITNGPGGTVITAVIDDEKGLMNTSQLGCTDGFKEILLSYDRHAYPLKAKSFGNMFAESPFFVPLLNWAVGLPWNVYVRLNREMTLAEEWLHIEQSSRFKDIANKPKIFIRDVVASIFGNDFDLTIYRAVAVAIIEMIESRPVNLDALAMNTMESHAKIRLFLSAKSPRAQQFVLREIVNDFLGADGSHQFSGEVALIVLSQFYGGQARDLVRQVACLVNAHPRKLFEWSKTSALERASDDELAPPKSGDTPANFVFDPLVRRWFVGGSNALFLFYAVGVLFVTAPFLETRLFQAMLLDAPLRLGLFLVLAERILTASLLFGFSHALSFWIAKALYRKKVATDSSVARVLLRSLLVGSLLNVVYSSLSLLVNTDVAFCFVVAIHATLQIPIVLEILKEHVQVNRSLGFFSFVLPWLQENTEAVVPWLHSKRVNTFRFAARINDLLVTMVVLASVSLRIPLSPWMRSWVPDAPLVTTVSGTRSVGASCHLVSIGGVKGVVDVGFAVGSESPVPDFSMIPDDIDFIIITHAHLDHIGSLPLLHKLLREKGRHVPIYATPETIQLMHPNLRMQNQSLRPYGVTGTDITDTLHYLTPLEFGQKRKLGKKAWLLFHRAGHLRGAATVELGSITGVVTVSGDLFLQNQATVEGAEFPHESPDLLIVESTYGGTDYRSRAHEVGRLIDTTAGAVRANKNVVFPVLGLGRSQELLLELLAARKKRVLPADVDIYIDGSIGSLNELYQLDIKESDRVFDLKSKRTGIGRNKVLQRLERNDGRPIILLATSGMLQSRSAIMDYLPRTLAHSHNVLGFVNYQPESGLGSRILSAQKGDDILIKNGTSIRLRSDIFSFQLSGHASGEELVQYVRSVNPRKVAVVHGELSRSVALATDPRLRSYEPIVPVVGESIPVPRVEFFTAIRRWLRLWGEQQLTLVLSHPPVHHISERSIVFTRINNPFAVGAIQRRFGRSGVADVQYAHDTNRHRISLQSIVDQLDMGPDFRFPRSSNAMEFVAKKAISELLRDHRAQMEILVELMNNGRTYSVEDLATQFQLVTPFERLGIAMFLLGLPNYFSVENGRYRTNNQPLPDFSHLSNELQINLSFAFGDVTELDEKGNMVPVRPPQRSKKTNSERFAAATTMHAVDENPALDLTEASHRRDIQDIDGNVVPFVHGTPTNVVVLLKENRKRQMLHTIQAMVASASVERPIYIYVITEDGRTAQELNTLSTFRNHAGVFIRANNRKGLLANSIVPFAELCAVMRTIRGWNPSSHLHRIVTSEEVSVEFGDDDHDENIVVMIIGALESIAATAKQLKDPATFERIRVRLRQV